MDDGKQVQGAVQVEARDLVSTWSVCVSCVGRMVGSLTRAGETFNYGSCSLDIVHSNFGDYCIWLWSEVSKNEDSAKTRQILHYTSASLDKHFIFSE